MSASRTTKLFGLDIYRGSLQELLALVQEKLKKTTQPLVIFTPNPEQIVQTEDKEFFQVLKQADILIPDGVGLMLASRLLSLFGRAKTIRQRIAGTDLVMELLQFTRKNKQQVLVVGGKNYQHHLSDFVKKELPGGKISWLEGYRNVRFPQLDEDKKLLGEISRLKPDVVFVAFGAPYQEKWVLENRKFLEENKVKLVMVAGGAFDFILGCVPRSPKLLRDFGLEWLFRLTNQPWRWKRQIRLVKFGGLVVREIFS